MFPFPFTLSATKWGRIFDAHEKEEKYCHIGTALKFLTVPLLLLAFYGNWGISNSCKKEH